MGVLPPDLQAGRKKSIGFQRVWRILFEANKEWLQPYAVFKLFARTPSRRLILGMAQTCVYNAFDIEKMCQPESVDYPHIAPLFLYSVSPAPATGTTKYARKHGVALKGRYSDRYQPQ